MKISTKEMVYIALFAALTAVGAWISLPLKPVPFTLQVFFVLLAGIVLGGRNGALSQVVYLIMGIIGLPVFAGGTSGLGALAGPSGGYLFGFVAAAYVVGKLCELKVGIPFVKAASPLAGIAVIYAMGVAQLSLVTGYSLGKSLALGAAPFILFDIVKAVVASGIAYRLQSAGVAPLYTETDQPV
ncbi:MAG: biotin transporter BioY [Candidatus Aquicultorales bacterium]